MTLKKWTDKPEISPERKKSRMEFTRASRICHCLTAALNSGDKKKFRHWQKIHKKYYEY